MRGYLQPAVRAQVGDLQQTFRNLSRHRRTKLARAARTTLVKADQWSRGEGAAPDVAAALEGAVKSSQAKRSK
jgi:hypothetical protein